MRQFAELAGISNPYLSQIERGLRAPSEQVLDAIAEHLKVSADALYEQAGVSPPGDEPRTPRCSRQSRPTSASRLAADGTARGLRGVRGRLPRQPGRSRGRPLMGDRRRRSSPAPRAGSGVLSPRGSGTTGMDVLSVDLNPEPTGPGSRSRPISPIPRRTPTRSPRLSRASGGSMWWCRTRACSTSRRSGSSRTSAGTRSSRCCSRARSSSPRRMAGAARVGGGAVHRDRVGARAGRLAVQGGVRVVQARRARTGEDARAGGRPDGITATAVCPGYVRTPLVEKQIADQALVHGCPRSACSRT